MRGPLWIGTKGNRYARTIIDDRLRNGEGRALVIASMYINSLVLIAFLGYPGAANSIPRTAASKGHQPFGDRQPPVIVVSDGSSGLIGETANRIAGQLKELLSVSHALQVIRFDAEPELHNNFSIKGARQDLVVVRSRTPMRDSMEAGFAYLFDAPRPRAMIVIAHEQVYRAGVSEDDLLDLARRSNTKVHTIHVSSESQTAGCFRRAGGSLRNAVISLVQRFGMEERGYSTRDTALLLTMLAEATGGVACSTGDERTGADCAKAVVAGIASGAPTRSRAGAERQLPKLEQRPSF